MHSKLSSIVWFSHYEILDSSGYFWINRLSSIDHCHLLQFIGEIQSVIVTHKNLGSWRGWLLFDEKHSTLPHRGPSNWTYRKLPELRWLLHIRSKDKQSILFMSRVSIVIWSLLINQNFTPNRCLSDVTFAQLIFLIVGVLLGGLWFKCWSLRAY